MSTSKENPKWELHKLLKEKVIRLARQDSYVFSEYIFSYNNAPFHRKWHDFIRTGSSGLILAFRGSGKSEQITISNSLWEIGNNPNIRIKIVTETDDLAEKLLQKIAEAILTNERYKEVFPHIEKHPTRSWNKHELTVKRTKNDKEPTIEAQSILSAATGKRADLIHYDDVVGMANTLVNPGKREIVKEAFRSNWQKVLDVIYNKDARWIMTCTPWHINDLVSELRNNKAVPRAEETWVGPNFESPWPGVISPQIFKNALATDGLRAYNRAYRGVALSDDETWINQEAVKSARDFNLKPYDVQIIGENIKFTGVDLGHRESEDACPSVIFTGVRTPTGHRIPIDIKITQQSSALELARSLVRTYNDFQPALITVENNGAQKYLTDIIEGLGPAGLPIEGHFTGTQKLNPETGVPSLLAEIESGKWKIPLGAGGDHPWDMCECNFCRWINEIKNYPLGRTDTVMACLTPKSKVLTNIGYVDIENVKEGQLVLTHKGNWRKVTDTNKRWYSGTIRKIKPVGFYELGITPDHLVWTSESRFEKKTNRLSPDENWSWKPSLSLSVGRKLKGSFLLSPITKFPYNSIDKIDLGDFVPHSKWQINDFNIYYPKSDYQKINRFIPINDDILLLLGLFLAEGSARENRHQTQFSFHMRERELIEFVKYAFLKYFGIASSEYTYEKCGLVTVVYVHSTPIYRFFSQFYNVKRKKCLPYHFMGIEADKRLAIIRGWFMGDGHIHEQSITGVTNSYDLMEQIRYTLLENGYLPTVNKFKQSTGKYDHQIRLSCNETAKFFKNILDLENKHWCDPSFSLIKCKTNNGYVKNKLGYAARIRSIKDEDYNGYVYNLHVEEDESFVVNGIAVHNCWLMLTGLRKICERANTGNFSVWEF